jgi:hypothetical protein
MRPSRVIVFGSRNWPAEYVGYIHNRIKQLPHGTVVVHGACPSGADAIADYAAVLYGFTVERHPAIWKPDGRLGRTDYAAGPRRNKHMASLGADLAIGFRMPGKSNGTDHMADECELARIPVERHGWGWPSGAWDRVTG